jgi:hypothetical protein
LREIFPTENDWKYEVKMMKIRENNKKLIEEQRR